MAEIAMLGRDRLGGMIQALSPRGGNQTVNYTATAGVSASSIGSNAVRVVCTSACFIEFGTNPTATTASTYMPAESQETFIINPSDKISVVRRTTDGTCFVTGML